MNNLFQIGDGFQSDADAIENLVKRFVGYRVISSTSKLHQITFNSNYAFQGKERTIQIHHDRKLSNHSNRALNKHLDNNSPELLPRDLYQNPLSFRRYIFITMPFSFTYDFLNTARVSITTKRHAAPPGTTVSVLPHTEAEEENSIRSLTKRYAATPGKTVSILPYSEAEDEDSIRSLTALEKLIHMLSAKEEDLTLVALNTLNTSCTVLLSFRLPLPIESPQSSSYLYQDALDSDTDRLDRRFSIEMENIEQDESCNIPNEIEPQCYSDEDDNNVDLLIKELEAMRDVISRPLHSIETGMYGRMNRVETSGLAS